MASVLIVLVLAACSDAQVATPATPSPTPQPTLTSTSTPVPPLTSTVVVPSATPTPFQKLRQTCVTSHAVNQANLAMRGVVVFDNFVPVSVERAIETIYLRDLEKATIKILPTLGEFDDFVGISPDHKKLLYQYWSKDDLRLTLTDAGGKPLIDFENGLGKENWYYLNWQDEETLRVARSAGR